MTIWLLTLIRRHVLGAAIELEVDVGDEPAEGRRAGDRPAIDDAVVRLVRVAGDEEVDGVGGAVDDVDDRAGEAVAVVEAEWERLAAALVQQDDDRAHAVLPAQHLRPAVRRLGLVEEREALDSRLRDDVRRAFERHADEAHLDRRRTCGSRTERRSAVRSPCRPRWLRGSRTRAAEPVRQRIRVRSVVAPVLRVAPAVLHAPQLVGALVELVVAHGVQVQAHHVHGLDRRLVVEERRDERAGADQVAGRDEQRVRVGPLERPDVRGEEGGPAGGHRRVRVGLVLPAPVSNGLIVPGVSGAM